MVNWWNECKKIKSKLEELYNIDNVDIRLIYKFLFINRKAIATYIRNIYIIDRLAFKNANHHISIDESLFTHNNGNQVWVVGLINIDTNSIRLEVVENRNSETMKEIIIKHAGEGNIINSDSWSAYNFLDNSDSGYQHNVYNHSNGIFGLLAESKVVWNQSCN